jgi:hypothetical protein
MMTDLLAKLDAEGRAAFTQLIVLFDEPDAGQSWEWLDRFEAAIERWEEAQEAFRKVATEEEWEASHIADETVGLFVDELVTLRGWSRSRSN